MDGFWSISVYDANGYYQPNLQNAYTLNNLTTKAGGDGAIKVQFGGLRWTGCQLPAHHARVELHGSPVPAPHGGTERLMDVPGGAVRKLM